MFNRTVDVVWVLLIFLIFSKLTCFINLFRLSFFLCPPDSFHRFLDLALIGFIYFLVSLFVNFLFWPRAVDQAGYSSVFERTLNIIISYHIIVLLMPNKIFSACKCKMFKLQMWVSVMKARVTLMWMDAVMQFCCLATHHLTCTSCWISSIIHRSHTSQCYFLGLLSNCFLQQ